LNSTNPFVSIVILTWNSEIFIEHCLESLAWQSYKNFEVIIVDNASGDETLKRIDSCAHRSIVSKVITNKKNLGCAGGNNVGWRASSGEIVIFLNPDTFVTKSWLEELVKALKGNPEAVIAGCKIYYPNTHTLQHAGGILHPNGMTDHYGNGKEDAGQYDELRDVDYVTGAAIAVKRDFMDLVGGFDEDYHPAYYEETDLCYRAHKKGFKVLYAPKALLYHYESPGLKKYSPGFFAMYYKMRFRFIIKNFTFLEILTKFSPFEIRWMLFEPRARGLRLIQFRAYWQGLKFLITGRP
jgi:GT2 family glycosyltransferase